MQAVLAAIGAFFRWLGDRALTIAIAVGQAMVQVGLAIAHFAVLVARVFAKTFTLLRGFWSQVLQPFVRWTWQGINRLHLWLEQTLGPVLRLLNAVRQWLEDFYQHWLRPIFDTIDAIRATARLLGALHLEWARKLDAWLGDLEARVFAAFAVVYVVLNRISEAVNRIIDLDGLIQRGVLLESLWRRVGDVWAVLLGHAPEGVSAAANTAKARQGYPLRDGVSLGRALAEYSRTGGGELAPDIRALVPVWRAATLNHA